MGRLVYLHDLDLDAPRYFPDAYYSREGNKYAYAWPNPAYPYTVAIHQDDLISQNSKKVKIRKWVEECLVETVIVATVNKSYRKFIDEDRDWEHSYDVTNNWVVFYFDNEHSALMFKIKFSDWVKSVTELHPTNGDEYEKTSHYKKSR